jgi:hypothetical protein
LFGIVLVPLWEYNLLLFLGAIMNGEGRKKIQAAIESSAVGMPHIYPEKPQGDVPFVDIIVRDAVTPSDVTNVLDAYDMMLRGNRQPNIGSGEPLLRQIGAYLLTEPISNVVVISFEDMNAGPLPQPVKPSIA